MLIRNVLNKFCCIQSKTNLDAQVLAETSVEKKGSDLQQISLASDLKDKARKFEAFIEYWKKENPESFSKFEQSTDYEALQSLFLGLRPYVNCLERKIPSGLAEKYSLKQANGSCIYDPKLVQKIIDRYPQYFDPKISPEELIENRGYFSRTLENIIGAIRYGTNYPGIKIGLLLGYPLEACHAYCKRDTELDFAKSTFGKYDLWKKNTPVGAYFFKMLESERCKQAIESVDKETRQELTPVLKKLIDIHLKRIDNLKKMDIPGVHWFPYGELGEESLCLINSYRKAFQESGMKAPPRQFSKWLLDGYYLKYESELKELVLNIDENNRKVF